MARIPHASSQEKGKAKVRGGGCCIEHLQFFLKHFFYWSSSLYTMIRSTPFLDELIMQNHNNPRCRGYCFDHNKNSCVCQSSHLHGHLLLIHHFCRRGRPPMNTTISTILRVPQESTHFLILHAPAAALLRSSESSRSTSPASVSFPGCRRSTSTNS